MWDWFTGGIGDLGGDIAALWGAIAWLATGVIAIADFLQKEILSMADFFKALIGKIGSLLQAIWLSFFKKIFTNAINALRKVQQWLESHLAGIIKFLQEERKWWDRMFRLYVQPILNLIQHVRQFLGILRLLGVKWAAALDAKLGKVEADIAGVFLAIRSVLTGFLDIVNALADPMNLLRRPTLVLSIRRILPTLCRVTTGLPLGFFLPSPRGNAPPGLGFLPDNFTASDPTYNPPASSYFLGDDGLGAFQGFTDGALPDDGAVDDLTLLDYFDEELYPPDQCTDLATCLQEIMNASANNTVVTAG